MRILFAILVVLFATPVVAEDLNSANYRVKGCRAGLSETMIYSSGYCLGLVDGIAWSESEINVLCLPSGVTLMQMARVVVAYIDARPARMHEDFRQLALQALHDAWPCKR